MRHRSLRLSPARTKALAGLASAMLLLAVLPASPAASSGGPRPPDAAGLLRLAGARRITPPASWRQIYHQVEDCSGKTGDFDAIQWAEMDEPLQGPKGTTYAFTAGSWIVLVRDDTTYLRHEVLHHVLTVAGWRPRVLAPGEHYTIADLHPMPLFGLCTGGR